jgi:hypothetical protein
MTAREQRSYTKLVTALRRILCYQTPKQLERSAGRAYGLQYCEALEMAYENMRGEAEAVRHLVRAPRPKPPATEPLTSESE